MDCLGNRVLKKVYVYVVICKIQIVKGRYCSHHKTALISLKKHYKIWLEAYGTLEWKNYLLKLNKLKETGKFVKEVIDVELKK
jgi:hypothetical protein